ncbi:hypothetical protein BASA81_006623 [Batrachochytrium salamandrivorans]|nr:hypothetical protein BASA81_006623 [Batrachochytrium salamandrivorans]
MRRVKRSTPWRVLVCIGLSVVLGLMLVYRHLPEAVEETAKVLPSPVVQVVATTASKPPAANLLRALLSKHGYKAPVPSEMDFLDPVFEKNRMALEIDLTNESIRLMCRRGHRNRVADLIGGEHLSIAMYLKRFAEFVKTFDSQAVSPRDFAVDKINSQRSGCNEPHIPMCSGGGQGPQVTISSTMENVPCNLLDHEGLCSNTQLTSDVPMPYISWHDFGVLAPLPPANHTRLGLAAAFISNCGFEKRNNMVKDLIRLTNGTVHSFGACVPSMNKPASPPFSGSRDNDKLAMLTHYKFSLAFENSETIDYVTEKFFGALCAGSVPVVIGAPNAAFFAPDGGPYPYTSKAMLHAKDFGFDAQRLANVMLALEANPGAYNEMLAWKRDGYSVDYKALVDLGDVHSDCRACIALADDIRHKEGVNVFDVRTLTKTSSHREFVLYVRERGTYSFIELGFPSKPTKLQQLVEATLLHVPERKKNRWLNNPDLGRQEATRVYAFYLPRPAKLTVLSNEDVQRLPNKCELEVIFV